MERLSEGLKMPTGYTDILDKNGDPIDWLKRTLVRNFGIGYAIRESSMDMSFEELDKRIREPRDISYYEKSLKKAKQRMAQLSNPSVAKAIYETEIRAEKERETKWREEIGDIREKHNRARVFLEAVKKENISKFTRDVADFGLDQLDVAKTDTEDFPAKPVLTFEFWLKDAKDKCQWDIDYHKKNIKESKERDSERAAYWNVFVEDVKKLEDKYRKL